MRQKRGKGHKEKRNSERKFIPWKKGSLKFKLIFGVKLTIKY